MRWPNIDIIQSNFSLPPGYKYSQLREAEISRLIQLIPKWYPDILVGEESCHLEEKFWQTRTQLEGMSEDRDYYPLLLRWQDEPVGFLTMQKNIYALTVMGRLGALAPEHHGSGFAKLGVTLMEIFAKAMGAEALLQIASLRSPHPQAACEYNGYTLCGILPGYDRDLVDSKTIKRVFEAYYIKLLIPESGLHQPQRNGLTPKTQELWNFLFPKMSLTN